MDLPAEQRVADHAPMRRRLGGRSARRRQLRVVVAGVLGTFALGRRLALCVFAFGILALGVGSGSVTVLALRAHPLQLRLQRGHRRQRQQLAVLALECVEAHTDDWTHVDTHRDTRACLAVGRRLAGGAAARGLDGAEALGRQATHRPGERCHQLLELQHLLGRRRRRAAVVDVGSRLAGGSRLGGGGGGGGGLSRRDHVQRQLQVCALLLFLIRQIEPPAVGQLLMPRAGAAQHEHGCGAERACGVA
jgi:hypothetical protein